MGTFGALAMVRTRIVAGPDRLFIQNIVRSYVVKWAEVQGFRAESNVVVVLRDGREIRCWAVQKANAARMTGRRSIVDRVAEDLENLRRAHESPVI